MNMSYLARLGDQAGEQFQGGMLVYTGRYHVKLNVTGSFAVPLSMLRVD
jgi:hypothetical protein